MRTTIGGAGRVLIPAGLRRAAALEPGMPLEVRSLNGVIEIVPQPLAVTLERRGRLLVAVAPKNQPRLTGEAVERTRLSLVKRGV